ncbi:MAG TPA: hypothetical protein VIU87_13895 [Mycobacterium sp.]
MPDIQYDSLESAELAELLHFLRDWLVTDNDNLEASLARFVGGSGYDLSELRSDIGRFAYLLAGDDGEQTLDTE